MTWLLKCGQNKWVKLDCSIPLLKSCALFEIIMTSTLSSPQVLPMGATRSLVHMEECCSAWQRDRARANPVCSLSARPVFWETKGLISCEVESNSYLFKICDRNRTHYPLPKSLDKGFSSTCAFPYMFFTLRT